MLLVRNVSGMRPVHLAQRALTTWSDDGDQTGSLCALLRVPSVEEREVGGRREEAGPLQLSFRVGVNGPGLGGPDTMLGRLQCVHLWSCSREGQEVELLDY